MQIRILAKADDTFEIPDDEYNKAEKDGTLEQLLDPYLDQLNMQIVYGPADAYPEEV